MIVSQKDFNAIVQLTPLVSIDLIMRNSQGEILLGLRKNEPAKERWFVPGGRIRKEDADLPAAFKRISTEELNVTLDLGDAEFFGVFEHRYSTNAAEEKGYGTYYIVLAYQAGQDLDTAKLPTKQHSAWRWFRVDDVNTNCGVHQYVKDYCSHFGEEPSAFSGNPAAGPMQYQLVATRRQGYDAMLWQTPAISLAAQAFLFTIVLDSNTGSGARWFAAFLAFVTALVSIHLMTKHRYFEKKDAKSLERFEILHHSTKGFRRLHGKESYPRGWRAFFVRMSAYVVWRGVLYLFALAALVAMCFPEWVEAWLIQLTPN